MAKQSTTSPNQRSRQGNDRQYSDYDEETRGGLREGGGVVSRGMRQVDHLVEDHEGQALLIALAAGFGIGCLIGCSLASGSSRSSNWSDRFAAEGLGRRVMESLDRVLPDAISSHFHS